MFVTEEVTVALDGTDSAPMVDTGFVSEVEVAVGAETESFTDTDTDTGTDSAPLSSFVSEEILLVNLVLTRFVGGEGRIWSVCGNWIFSCLPGVDSDTPFEIILKDGSWVCPTFVLDTGKLYLGKLFKFDNAGNWYKCDWPKQKTIEISR